MAFIWYWISKCRIWSSTTIQAEVEVLDCEQVQFRLQEGLYETGMFFTPEALICTNSERAEKCRELEEAVPGTVIRKELPLYDYSIVKAAALYS